MAEQAPPPEKRSFAPSEEEMKKQPLTQAKEIPSAEVSLHMINGKLDILIEEMKAFNSLFSKASQLAKSQVSFTSPTNTQPTPNASAPLGIGAPAPTPEISPRIKEILSALEPVRDLLVIDTEGSTMLILVKPAQFLGSDNFAKVASIVRGLGGQYVSAGKNSHFEIPKAPKKA